jgi:hypothetical protein
MESSRFDFRTISIKLVRGGNVLKILFSSSFDAELLYRELAERYKPAEERLKGEWRWRS